jgi:hypothetical protein
MLAALNRAGAWLRRWQEFVGWAPVTALVALATVVFLGAIPGLLLPPDVLADLAHLPVRAAYAITASGLAYLGWRRWSMRLNDQQLTDFWTALMAGHRGALVVFLTNAAFYLCTFVSLLVFFSLAG